MKSMVFEEPSLASPRSVLDTAFSASSCDSVSESLKKPFEKNKRSLFKAWSFGLRKGGIKSAEASPCDSPRRPVLVGQHGELDIFPLSVVDGTPPITSPHSLRASEPLCCQESLREQLLDKKEEVLKGRTRKTVGIPDKTAQQSGSSENVEPAIDDGVIQTVTMNLTQGSNKQKYAAALTVRTLAKASSSFRIAFGKAGIIKPLLNVLGCKEDDILEHALLALCNISIGTFSNKAAVIEGGATPRLVELLGWQTLNVREAAAAVILTLAAEDAHKPLLGSSGAIPALTTLLISGTCQGKSDAAQALYNLVGFEPNRKLLLEAKPGPALLAVLEEASHSRTSEHVLSIVQSLATSEEGRSSLANPGTVASLVRVLTGGSETSKEISCTVLLALCADSKRCRCAAVENDATSKLINLGEKGSPRAKEKARILLRCLEKPGSAPMVMSQQACESSRLYGAGVGSLIVQQMALESSREAMLQLKRRAKLR